MTITNHHFCVKTGRRKGPSPTTIIALKQAHQHASVDVSEHISRNKLFNTHTKTKDKHVSASVKCEECNLNMQHKKCNARVIKMHVSEYMLLISSRSQEQVNYIS